MVPSTGTERFLPSTHVQADLSLAVDRGATHSDEGKKYAVDVKSHVGYALRPLACDGCEGSHPIARATALDQHQSLEPPYSSC